MADTESYQPDPAGSALLNEAKQKTADGAKKQAETQAKDSQAAKNAVSMSQGMQAAKKAQAAGDVKGAREAQAQIMGSFKKGGTVPKTGNYKLHAGEEVVPNNGRASEYRKIFKSRGDAGKHQWMEK